MNTPIRQTCSNATISLIFGILSWVILPFIGAVIAIICGHMARGEIRRSQGALDGDGLAVGGLVLGYLHLAVFLLVLIAIFLFFGGLAAFLAFAAQHHT
ncbi:MAG TPA: DUF4190 domain-containing protein [Xanthomonadaceae bacterium]|nr:DUF4190 domain-containing protein [Xanthomonadaceae bacterium]